MSRRTATLTALVLAAVTLSVAILLLAGDGDGDKDGGSARPSGSSGAAGAPTTTPGVVRATGPGSCAFVSTDEVKQATGASQVQLLQALGPTGNPGCEWSLGDERRLLQLEFQAGRTPGTLPAQGDDVSGPWDGAKWVASSRTLYVLASGQQISVRATDGDPARAQANSTAVAALAALRN